MFKTEIKHDETSGFHLNVSQRLVISDIAIHFLVRLSHGRAVEPCQHAKHCKMWIVYGIWCVNIYTVCENPSKAVWIIRIAMQTGQPANMKFNLMKSNSLWTAESESESTHEWLLRGQLMSFFSKELSVLVTTFSPEYCWEHKRIVAHSAWCWPVLGFTSFRVFM